MSQGDRRGDDYLSRAAVPGTPEFYRDLQLADLIARSAEAARRENSTGTTDYDRDHRLARMIAEEIEQVRLEKTPGTPEYEAKRQFREFLEAYDRERQEKARRKETPGTPEYDRETKLARLRGNCVDSGSPPGLGTGLTVTGILLSVLWLIFYGLPWLITSDEVIAAYLRVVVLAAVLLLIVFGGFFLLGQIEKAQNRAR